MRLDLASRRDLFGLGAGLATAAIAAPALAGGRIEIWFIRHAESLVNVAADPEVPDEGVSYPLTAKGVRQANKLAKALKDVPVTAIWSSTRLRCLQTADAIAFRKALTLELAPGAVEFAFDIKALATGGLQALIAVLQQWAQGNTSARAPGGESLDDVLARFRPEVERITTAARKTKGVTVLTSHGGTLGYGLPYILKGVSIGFAAQNGLRNTGIVKAELRGKDLVCTEWQGLTPA
jgi:broad specificity phosphatase PhoE